MAKISIVHEPTEINVVSDFALELQQNGDDIELICRDNFPVADAMLGFLHKLSTTFDRTFILISGKTDSILSTWISKELAIQHTGGNFSNVYPAFAKVEDIQEWWPIEDVMIFSRV